MFIIFFLTILIPHFGAVKMLRSLTLWVGFTVLVAIIGCSWNFDKVKNPITFQNNRKKLKFMEN